ncbi:MAG: flagellar basal body rod protein FlgB [Candidatus Aenigmarchaeota archaeon]|nr:flagellar basal body rod protein FlgB [Candidatus Aenigmarchaeota archaeon]
MDILNKNAIEITSLAMDGLSARHKAIASNIANANTPNYKKFDVTFENQLKKILESEKTNEQNKLNNFSNKIESVTPKNNLGYSDFSPKITISKDGAITLNGNNVNIESEMAELAKNGMKYNALAVLQAKAFRGLADVIKGGGM